ncbi:MAG: clostripain-related cysteine peptidase [Spirochaetales bacterium]
MQTQRNYLRLALFLGALMLLSGTAGAQARDWTVLVYLMADNNLETAAMTDIAEMTQADTGTKASIVMQVTASGDNNDEPKVVNLNRITTTKRLEARKGSLKELADLGKINSADPKKLAEFISWGIKTYPAQHYALVLWDHGGAWPGYGEDDAHDGAGFDLAGLTSAITDGLKGGAVKQLDLLGFDACLMATYEVARAVRPLAKYLLASEELEPGHGWDYSVLTALAKNPNTEALGKTIIKGFADSSTAEGDREEVTLSLLNLQKMDALDAAVSAFATYGRTKISQIAPQLGRIQNKTQGFGKSAKPEEDTNMIDLGQFVSLYAETDTGAGAIKKQFDAALAALVVDKISGNLTKGSTGLSIYFPNQKRYYSAPYDAIDSGPWKALLADYYKGGSSLSPAKSTGTYNLAFTNADNTGDLSVDADGMVTLTGTLPKDVVTKVVEGLFSFGMIDGEDLVFLGDTEVFIDDETGEVSGTWDLQILKMKQGKNEAYCYSSETGKEDGGFEYTIPLRYYEKGKISGDGEDISLVLNTDAEYNVTGQEYFSTVHDKWGAFTPRKGSVVVPTWERATGDGESVTEATTDVGFDPTKGLTYDYEAIDTETTDIYLELEVYDVGDNSDYVSYEGSAAK